MRSLFAVLALVSAVGSMVVLPATDFDLPGGAGATLTCNARMHAPKCEGSYIGSTGCGAFSVSRFDTSSWTHNTTQSTNSTTNCNVNFDVLGVACAGRAEQRNLPNLACASNTLWVPW